MPVYERELERFRAHDAQVVGISTDPRPAQAAWAKQLGLSYPLLSDFFPHGAVAQQYGIFTAHGMSERAVFIIDATGTIRYIDVHAIGEVPDEEQIFEQLAGLRTG